ncbi:MAG: hypothetical protein IT379_14905 [Deltaproteobacteria bacterium]|nr:hypothetical protein [Deltaproteobacteria bacterium]
MLVVISDLHFVDGTAGDHNVACDAFTILMEDVLPVAKDKGAKTLDFLFLGDIFDLIRTESWLEDDVPLAHRPWGDPDINAHPEQLGEPCLKVARAILDDIGVKAGEQLAVLRGEHASVKEAFEKLGKPVRRLYVPGNHDRLYLLDPAIRAKVDALLGLTALRPAELANEHVYRSPAHGVVARHGHEFDSWNFEGFGKGGAQYAFTPTDYLRVPIGDVITTELVVRLPREVKKRLEGVIPSINPAVIAGVYARLQNIENVRPVTAAIPWIWHQAGAIGRSASAPGGAVWQGNEKAQVIEAVKAAAAQISSEFMAIPFVERWIDQHDKWGIDEADKLQGLTGLLKLGLGLRELSGLLKTYDAFQRIADRHADPQQRAAFDEPDLAGNDCHYAVYGHTHEFEQTALRVDETGHEKLYLNSGTWRPRFFLADDRKSFVEWKEMTYLVFFTKDEDQGGIGGPQKGHSFHTWTGTMLKRKRH